MEFMTMPFIGDPEPAQDVGSSSPPPIEFVSPPSSSPDLDNDHDDAPVRFRRLDDVLGEAAVPGLAPRVLGDELLAVSAEEPTTFAAAEREPCWRAAMVEELRSIEDNSTWEAINLPTGHRAIGLKWVFKTKRDDPFS